MSIKIEPLNNKEEWNEIVGKHGADNLLQSWSWTEFQMAYRKQAWRLGMYEDGKLISVCFAYLIKTKFRTHIYTSNGPVMDWSDSKTAGKLMKIWIDYFGKIAVPEVNAKFVRFDPILEANPENLMFMKNLGLQEAAISVLPQNKWTLDITPDHDTILAGMRKNTRYAVRKSAKDGVTVEKSMNIANFDSFWEIYTQTFTRQEFVHFPKDYYIKQIEAFNNENPGSYQIFTAKFNGKAIASALFAFENGTAYYLHAASDQSAKELSAPHLIIWEAILEAKARGCTKFDFWGVAPENVPNHPWAGFSFFKKGFGGTGSEVIPAFDLPTSKQYFAIKMVESPNSLVSKVYRLFAK